MTAEQPKLNRKEVRKWVEKRIWASKSGGTSLRVSDGEGFSRRANINDIIDLIAQALADQRENDVRKAWEYIVDATRKGSWSKEELIASLTDKTP